MTGNHEHPHPEWSKEMQKHFCEAREKKGLLQIELEKRCGFGPGIISHIESGTRTPSIRTFLGICRVLEINPDVALGMPNFPEIEGTPLHNPLKGWQGALPVRLEYARRRGQWLQKGLGRVTGISPVLISNVEHGKKKLSLGNLVLLCCHLKVSVCWMLGQSGFSSRE